MKLIAFGVLLVSALLTAQTQAPSMPPSVQVPSNDFDQARRLMDQGNYDEAVLQLSNLGAKKPGLKGLASELGTAYYKKGDYVRAVDAFKQALTEDPENKEAVQLLGLSYYLSGRPGEAIPSLEKVQAWYPRANVDAA